MIFKNYSAAAKSPLLFGVASKGKNYDLPLHTRLGTEFLVMLLALMTCLSLLTVLGSFGLYKMAQNWQGNLKNTLTLEIPYGEKQKDISGKVEEFLKENPNVAKFEVLDDAGVQKLLQPWLGDLENVRDALPMPQLISIYLKDIPPENLETFQKEILEISETIKLDGHEEWLQDLEHLTHSLQFIGILLVSFISLVTFLTVSGAVRSRMAIHQTELELLHIMGATDSYIRNQFQRYIIDLASKGLGMGLCATLIFVGLLYVLSLNLPATLPQFKFYAEYLILVPLVCFILLGISIGAARHTVHHVLRDIP